MKKLLILGLLAAFTAAPAADKKVPAHPAIQIETTEGIIRLELDGRRAPLLLLVAIGNRAVGSRHHITDLLRHRAGRVADHYRI